MDIYAPTIELTYDPAIYWLEPHIGATMKASRSLIEESPEWAGRVSYDLDQALKNELRTVGWVHYTVVDQLHEDDPIYDARTFRRHAYEQPGFTKVHRYAGPPQMRELFIQPPHGAPIALELRRMMWHGRRERAALYGTELYVVYADIKPEARGGIRDA